jgi:hypothetical protein
MGLYNGNLTNYYNGNEPPLGAYQFISITDIINNFMVVYVGEDKIIPNVSRADVRFHASRAIQELTYDTFRSCKNLQMEVPPSLKLPLPHDYVNYVRLTVSDGENDENCKTLLHCKACPRDPLTLEKLLEDHEDDDVVYGCTDPEACNYDPLAEVNDFSCEYPPVGAGCGGDCLDGYTPVGEVCVPEVIGCTDATALNYNALANISCNGCCCYCEQGCMDPSACNYDASATCPDPENPCIYAIVNHNCGGDCVDGYIELTSGELTECVPCIYGCMEVDDCNYDSEATCDDGTCSGGETQNLSGEFYAFGSTDPIPIDGTAYSLGGMHAYPRTSGEQVFGGHTTRGHGGTAAQSAMINFGSTPVGVTNVYSEAYAFPMNCVVGQTYPISWWELVMAIRTTGMCSDCLKGGWWIKVAQAPSGCIQNSTTGVWSGCNATGADFFDTSTSIYNPVTLNTLTVADPLFHNSLPATNDVGNGNNQNTAGASNGSHSEWNPKTTSFVATHPKMIVQFAVTTNWTQCTACHSHALPGGKHGVYMGLTEVLLGGTPCPPEDCGTYWECLQEICRECSTCSGTALPLCTNNIEDLYLTQVDCCSACNRGKVCGCTDPTASNYDATATQDNGSCTYTIISGCTDPTATNYNASATVDDGSCCYVAVSTQTMDATPGNSNGAVLATVTGGTAPYTYLWDDASAQTTNPATGLAAGTYSVTVTDANGCTVTAGASVLAGYTYGCIDPLASNYSFIYNTDDGGCLYDGCTDATANNYDASANNDDGSCTYTVISGCTDPTATNYNASATVDDGSCIPCVYGCNDPTAFNYDPLATCDDGSCIPYTYGCTDPTADNYNPSVNTSDNSCVWLGCTDPTASNYDATANVDDGSCTYSCQLTGTNNNLIHIPDANFRSALEISGATLPGAITSSSWQDLNGSANISGEYILYTDIANITQVSVGNQSIADLTGIECFTALTFLNCNYNPLGSLDLGQNTALTDLYCGGNQLTSLNVSQNTALIELYCEQNQLTSLDVSQNTALAVLYCEQNQLTSLNLTQNTALIDLVCPNNNLTSLNVSLNTALTDLLCYDIPSMATLNIANGNNGNMPASAFKATGNGNPFTITCDTPANPHAVYTVAAGCVTNGTTTFN